MSELLNKLKVMREERRAAGIEPPALVNAHSGLGHEHYIVTWDELIEAVEERDRLRARIIRLQEVVDND